MSKTMIIVGILTPGALAAEHSRLAISIRFISFARFALIGQRKMSVR